MAGGKWSHMMDQTHIGYTYWQQPDENTMPQVTEIENPDQAEMGISVEGSDVWWRADSAYADPLSLPEFTPFGQKSFYFEIFNRGREPFEYTIQTGQPWVMTSSSKGAIDTAERIEVSVDWSQADNGRSIVPLTITASGLTSVVVQAVVHNPDLNIEAMKDCFIEANGSIAIEAEHASKIFNNDQMSWLNIPGLGRTLSGMTLKPATAPVQSPDGSGPYLEYNLFLFSSGEVNVRSCLSPTLNFHNNQGLRFAVSIDDQEPQIINMHQDRNFQDWEESVRNNITTTVSKHMIDKPGRHILRFWAIDPGIVLQRVIVETGDPVHSYLGPPESILVK